MGKNSAFMKGLAGFGAGLSQAGFMGYKEKLDEKLESRRAELLSQRDKVLNGYAEGLQKTQIASNEGIATQNADVTGASIMSRSETGRLNRQSSEQIAKDKITSAEKIATGSLGKPIRMSDGVVYVEGKFQMLNPDDIAGGGAPSERDKFNFDQKKALTTMLNSQHGGLLEKLNNTERKEFQHMFIKASELIDGGTKYNVAYEKVLSKWVRDKETNKVIGEEGSSSNSSWSGIFKDHGVPGHGSQ